MTNDRQATKALLYCRVSTTKQTIEGSGLQSQELRCRAYAAEKGYTVEAVFPDDASGGGDYMARPGMMALLAYLDAKPDEAFVVIFDDLKRFARDTAFHLKLRQELAARRASVECPNFKFEDTPEGQFVETVFAAQGELERKQNARQTIQKMKARIEAGFYCRSKVVGYRYEKTEHGKMLVPDEPAASLIREAFEGYAAGRFETAADVSRFFLKHPSFSGAMNRQRATDILRRPLYAGYISIPNWGFHMHKGKHEPLVSLDLWQSVQDRLDGKKKRPARCDVHEDFPLRNFVACEGCGNPLTAANSRGSKGKLYGYYVCQQKACDWRGKSIRKEKIEEAFGQTVRAMIPAPSLLNVAKTMFADLWDQAAAHARSRHEQLNVKIAELDARKAALMKRLVAASCDDVAAAYEEEIARIAKERRLLQERCQVALEPRKPFSECFRAAMNLIANPWVLWESGSFAHKRLLLRLVIPTPIPYRREQGFSNPELSLPFKILGGADMQNLRMVPRRGLEPPRP